MGVARGGRGDEVGGMVMRRARRGREREGRTKEVVKLLLLG